MAVIQTERKLVEIPDVPPSTETKSGIPKHELEAIVRTFLPDIIAFFQSEEGQRQYREWKKEQERLKQQSQNISE